MPPKLPKTSHKICTKCYLLRPIEMFSVSKNRVSPSAKCKFCHREANNLRNRATRYEVLAYYSKSDKPFCACCGEDKTEFLSLDHIHGGGRQHRKTIKIRWWEWLKKNGFPEGFRVLCHNCNQSIGLYGYCPHKTDDSQFTEALAKYDKNAPNKGHKLSKLDAEEIRKQIKNGVPQITLALKYSVSRAAICKINKGKVWGDYDKSK